MKTLTITLFVSVACFLGACKKSEKTCTDSSAPGQVTNPQVQNLPGSAKISYNLPNNTNLLYVKAVCNVKDAVKEVKASMYTNSLLIEGFGDTLEHKVKLYAVSRCEVESQPVEVTIKPLRPSIWDVYYSLNVIETFGGINVSYINATRSNIVIGILVKDSTNFWQHVDFHYSSQAQNNFNIRGFVQNPPAQPQKQYVYGIYVKDRWDNHTDTLVVTKAPIYEELVDKTKFKDIRSMGYPIPQLAPMPLSGGPIVNAVDYSSSYPLKNLWDGSTTTMFHTKQNVDQPIWVPIDLDQSAVSKYKLSRFKVWQRTGTFTYNHGNPHKWEIWGTNTPTVVGSWVKLGDWLMTKPSGLPVGTNSNEDTQVATDGQEYDFPAGIPAVRYIAWKNVDCWSAIDGATGFFHVMELTLWGQKQ
ncbi:MAG TPA: DUF5000 domain-containing lipoprotein [Chitinophagaceae bacterium]